MALGNLFISEKVADPNSIFVEMLLLIDFKKRSTTLSRLISVTTKSITRAVTIPVEIHKSIFKADFIL